MNKILKIFTYLEATGELIEENLYSDFIFVFNDVISHNFIYEKEKRNIIVGTEYPPKNLLFKDRQWQSENNIIINDYTNILKNFF